MFRTKLLHLKFIDGLEQWQLENLADKLTTRYNETKGFGFVNTEAFSTVISSTLVYQLISRQKVFEPELNILTTQERVTFHYVPFRIDLETGLLEAEIGGRKLAKLLSVIGKLLNFKVTIDDLYIKVDNFFRELNRRNLIYNITNITVTNYKPEIGLSGRFIASVYEQNSAQSLIETYGMDIRNIEIELYSTEFATIWRLSSSGSIAVRTEEDELDDSIALLKEIILRCRDA